ncbi:hypothetical protein L226DRAFT_520097 [Lentinus tigrinus ALCF2SS1-7]|uniref:Uncharacterized protein n=1 Tax=Lentinus tigrinus ALCF2SS1-6 TaxID=1328759 RepID=A0A5C2SP28_9APHY|nr:hypothetical protein L227DRAFT_631143 [Lentinus tigrinus ALCF2SS1-6]RPD79026.1 hypothetical protein L226DRAFT_520097 [Lentinus tigrinus ALCF2SS1-7]
MSYLHQVIASMTATVPASSESMRSADLLLLSPHNPISTTSASPVRRTCGHIYPTGLLSLCLSPSARTASEAAQEVRKTLVNLVQGLVRGDDPDCVLAILLRGRMQATSHLQERLTAVPTPHYSAVVNRANVSPNTKDITYLHAMLAYAAPLSTATIDDVRLACLHSRDNTLFQCLRRILAFSPLSPQETLILGSNVPVDEVDARDTDANAMSFLVDYEFEIVARALKGSFERTAEKRSSRIWRVGSAGVYHPDSDIYL